MKKDFTPEATAAILGNIDVETGSKFLPTTREVKEGGWGPGVGLFQFSYPAMKKAYKEFLNKTDREDSPEAQITFVREAMKSNKYYEIGQEARDDLKAIFDTNDVVEITKGFSEVFLKPGTPHMERRIASALEFYNKMV